MDSIPVDSSKIVNPVLAGHWVVKMTCTETTCTGSAIGDTRTEQWEIAYQAENIIARAMMNGNLVRAYTGSYNGSMLELTEAREQNTADPVSKMTVRLRLVDDNTMDGTREIIRENNCKVVFAMEMKKQ